MAAADALPELVMLRILELLPLRDRLRAARLGQAGTGSFCGAVRSSFRVFPRSRPPSSASSCVQA
uniref:F-box domain-containing protein n=1 Tax=Meleagris gallopavo TaxID=9103 RepID=A0A803Y812_MELGA